MQALDDFLEDGLYEPAPETVRAASIITKALINFYGSSSKQAMSHFPEQWKGVHPSVYELKHV